MNMNTDATITTQEETNEWYAKDLLVEVYASTDPESPPIKVDIASCVSPEQGGKKALRPKLL